MFPSFNHTPLPARKTVASLLLAAMLPAMAYSQQATDVAAELAGQRVVFLGDSITQAGGYVSFTAYFLEKHYPEKQFDIYGLGLSSETLSGLSEPNHAGGRFPRPCLFERLGRLLEKAKPDVVFACYGMNDGIYMPLDEKRQTAFRDGVKKLASQCHDAGVKRVYLITPPIYDFPKSAKGFNYESVLAAYSAWEMELKIPNVQVIDLHTPMKQAREKRETPFSKDRVHPGEDGHLFMAVTLLKGLGVELEDTSLADIKADPLYKEVDRLRRLRSSRWMKHIGYTREKTVVPEPLGDTMTDAEKIRQRIIALKK